MTSGLVDKLRLAIGEKRNYRKHNIYLVGSDIIAKGFPSEKKDKAKQEYDFGLELEEIGVNVPKMEDLVEVEYYSPYATGSKYPRDWFIFMQRITGKEAFYLDGSVKKEAIRQYKEQVNKILDKGIIPEDSFFSWNSIFNEEEDRLYLIDFGLYFRGEVEEVESFRKMVNKDDFKFSRAMYN